MPMLITLRIALAGVTLPLARAHPLGEVAHPVEHPVDLGHHVDPVDDERGPLGHAQGHVQHRPVLGDVDPLAGEHRVPSPASPDSSASCTSRLKVSSVIRFLE